MNLPIYEIFSKGVQVTVWENNIPCIKDGVTLTNKSYNIKVKERYMDKQGLRHDREFFSMESIPLLIASLQKVYEEFNTMVTIDKRIVK